MKTTALLSVLMLSVVSLRAGEGDVVKVSAPAPSFSGSATDGSQVSLEVFRGKVVLLDFFATWCGPCMTEMPLVEKDLWQRYKSAGLVVIGVGRGHEVGELATFAQKKPVSFLVVADPKKEIYSKYASMYIPRCYLIGKDGVVKYASVGYTEADFAELQAAVAAELQK